MHKAARYVNIVEWSNDDRCFVGSCQSRHYAICLHGAMTRMKSRYTTRRLQYVASANPLTKCQTPQKAVINIAPPS